MMSKNHGAITVVCMLAIFAGIREREIFSYAVAWVQQWRLEASADTYHKAQAAEDAALGKDAQLYEPKEKRALIEATNAARAKYDNMRYAIDDGRRTTILEFYVTPPPKQPSSVVWTAANVVVW